MWPFSESNNEVVEIEVDDGKGGKVWKRVNKAKFDALVQPAFAEGKARFVDVCIVNILDINEVKTAEFILGEDVSKEQFDMLSTNGEMYMLVFYEAGKPVKHLVKKALWEEMRRRLESLY